nr:NAC domain-containing protein 67-like [Tanacetum cinerariifolium]
MSAIVSVASPPSIIADVDLYKHEPWDLPGTFRNKGMLDDWVLCRVYNKKNNNPKEMIIPQEDNRIRHSRPDLHPS